MTTKREMMEAGIAEIIEGLGYDPNDQHFEDTPARVVRWLMEFMPPKGPIEEVLKVQFEEAYDELVMVKRAPFVALCAHHMLPFEGVGSVAYIPKGGKVVGLSKLARALEYHAHRLTLQERITHNLVEDLMRVLDPLGAMVVLESEHQCMTIRGVEAHGASMVTSGVRGVFRDPKENARLEFMMLHQGLRGVMG